MSRDYDALLIDLDGTLVDDTGCIHPRTRDALRRAHAEDVRIVIATGRSEMATAPVLEELGLGMPAVVYNGAAVYCPQRQRLVEERTLSNRTRDRAIEFGLERSLPVVVLCAGVKYALPARDDEERAVLRGMTGLREVDADGLRRDRTIRVTLFSPGYERSSELGDAIEAHIDQPIYLTHFPMNVLAEHRDCTLFAADVHPPCLGKGEALRLVHEQYGIAPERVVAIGDATNDLDMMNPAGLSLAMAGSMEPVLEAADRVIGANDTDTIADVVEELFLGA